LSAICGGVRDRRSVSISYQLSIERLQCPADSLRRKYRVSTHVRTLKSSSPRPVVRSRESVTQLWPAASLIPTTVAQLGKSDRCIRMHRAEFQDRNSRAGIDRLARRRVRAKVPAQRRADDRDNKEGRASPLSWSLRFVIESRVFSTSIENRSRASLV